MKSIDEKIYDLRRYLKLSQASFAEPLNLSPTHIARFEKGISPVSNHTFNLICEKFNVNPRYFEDNVDMAVEDAVTLITDDEKNRAVGSRLKAARLEKGLSQMKLKDLSGIEQSVITRVENGAKLTEKAGRRLAEALEVGYEWLMTGDESKKLYPADERLINWLWKNEEIREEIWKRMKEDEKGEE